MFYHKSSTKHRRLEKNSSTTIIVSFSIGWLKIRGNFEFCKLASVEIRDCVIFQPQSTRYEEEKYKLTAAMCDRPFCASMETHGADFRRNVRKYRSVSKGPRRLKRNNTIPETLQQPRRKRRNGWRSSRASELTSFGSQSGKRQLIHKPRQEFTTRPLSRETIVGR